MGTTTMLVKGGKGTWLHGACGGSFRHSHTPTIIFDLAAISSSTLFRKIGLGRLIDLVLLPNTPRSPRGLRLVYAFFGTSTAPCVCRQAAVLHAVFCVR